MVMNACSHVKLLVFPGRSSYTTLYTRIWPCQEYYEGVYPSLAVAWVTVLSRERVGDAQNGVWKTSWEVQFS